MYQSSWRLLLHVHKFSQWQPEQYYETTFMFYMAEALTYMVPRRNTLLLMTLNRKKRSRD